MNTVIITGAAGLIGSESVQRFARKGFRVVGMDNNLRRWFFGAGAATPANRRKLIEAIPLE
jgi:CDP-paratose 2-epimerase